MKVKRFEEVCDMLSSLEREGGGEGVGEKEATSTTTTTAIQSNIEN
jgi:hypothetical protein